MLSMKYGTVTQLGLFNDWVDKKRVDKLMGFGHWYISHVDDTTYVIRVRNVSVNGLIAPLMKAGVKSSDQRLNNLLEILVKYAAGDRLFIIPGAAIQLKDYSFTQLNEFEIQKYLIGTESYGAYSNYFKEFLAECDAMGVPYRKGDDITVFFDLRG